MSAESICISAQNHPRPPKNATLGTRNPYKSQRVTRAKRFQKKIFFFGNYIANSFYLKFRKLTTARCHKV